MRVAEDDDDGAAATPRNDVIRDLCESFRDDKIMFEQPSLEGLLLISMYISRWRGMMSH